ncbi:MAG: ATP-binding protein [Firmicutes bacterium]|nr:ATP-binding protein [Bacillota bacterium]
MIDLEKLELYRENNRIEAKKALGGLPHSIWETYSAFANTMGGLILLGVEEFKDKSLHTVDLPDPGALCDEFWALVNDPGKASVNTLKRSDIAIEEVNGDHIVIINVPKAPRRLRPVYVEGDPQNTYRRSGESDVKCDSKELDLMKKDARYMKAIVGFLTDVISASPSQVAEHLGISLAASKNLLEKLVEDGVVVPEEGRRRRSYRLRS